MEILCRLLHVLLFTTIKCVCKCWVMLLNLSVRDKWAHFCKKSLGRFSIKLGKEETACCQIYSSIIITSIVLIWSPLHYPEFCTLVVCSDLHDLYWAYCAKSSRGILCQQTGAIAIETLLAILCLRWLAKSTCVCERTLFMIVFGIQPCRKQTHKKMLNSYVKIVIWCIFKCLDFLDIFNRNSVWLLWKNNTHMTVIYL